MKRFSTLAGALLSLAYLLPSPALAQGDAPGSLLLFPEYDNRLGVNTFLTVTNTNLQDSVRVEFVYIGKYGSVGKGQTEELPCLEFNRTRTLTPGDTLTLLSKFDNPQFEAGYVYVFAKDAQGAAISFDHLVGNMIKVDFLLASDWSMNPTVFQGVPADGMPTDLDSDGIRDLNGAEYTQAPDLIVIPRFFGQTLLNRPSELIFVALSGGTAFTTTLDFLIWNDNEEVFSAQYSFRCWDKQPLLHVSGLFANQFLKDSTNHDANEVEGLRSLESGWIWINGRNADSTAASIQDPAFMAYLVEGGAVLSAVASHPFMLGEQDNGDLLPTGPFGDTVNN